MGWGCWVLRLLPNSVIINLHSSVSLSLEQWLSNLTNLIHLIITITHQLDGLYNPLPARRHSSSTQTTHTSSSISPTSLISLTSSALCTSLSRTTALWHSLSLSLTKSLSLSLPFSHYSSNSNQQVLEKHFVVSANKTSTLLTLSSSSVIITYQPVRPH